jgi:hypothetical protein
VSRKGVDRAKAHGVDRDRDRDRDKVRGGVAARILAVVRARAVVQARVAVRARVAVQAAAQAKAAVGRAAMSRARVASVPDVERAGAKAVGMIFVAAAVVVRRNRASVP